MTVMLLRKIRIISCPLWATNTGTPYGASSVLMIRGSYENNSLSLWVYDYSRKQQTAVLYPVPDNKKGE